MMLKKRLFLASSSELKEDRNDFEIFIGRKNKDWVDRGVFLELIIWEDFLDAVSRTRLQDEYNKAIRECDIFVMLFFTKVGEYTEEEFETAFGQFMATNKPFIFTYFKEPADKRADTSGSANKFQKKLAALGHFYTRYKNIDELKFHFNQQLDKLVASRFIEFKPEGETPAASGGTAYQANLTSDGIIAQGPGATAVGPGGVNVGGNNTANINTGTQVNTGGGAYVGGNVSAGGDFVGRDQITKVTQGLSAKELEPLFAPLLSLIAQQAAADNKTAAMQQAQELKTELAKGEQADDSKMGKIIEGLADRVPGAIATVIGMFTTPILSGIAGPVTKYVLDTLKSE